MSTEAKIGDILIFIGIILGIIAALVILMIGTAVLGTDLTVPSLLFILLVPLGMVRW